MESLSSVVCAGLVGVLHKAWEGLLHMEMGFKHYLRNKTFNGLADLSIDVTSTIYEWK